MHYIIVSSNARLTVFNVNLTIRTFKIVSDLRKKTPDAGRGLQPRPKRLHASISFETLNVKDGVTNPVPLVVMKSVASMQQGGIEDLQRSEALDSTAFHRGYLLLLLKQLKLFYSRHSDCGFKPKHDGTYNPVTYV